MQDITPPERIQDNPKCDREVTVYGYLRGSNLKPGTQAHLAGVGDMMVSHAPSQQACWAFTPLQPGQCMRFQGDAVLHGSRAAHTRSVLSQMCATAHADCGHQRTARPLPLARDHQEEGSERQGAPAVCAHG